jgi:hypothetical protein
VQRIEAINRFRKELVQLVGGEAEADGLPRKLAQLVDEPLAMDGKLPALRPRGNEGPLAVSHFEQPFATESLVNAEDRVLIDGKLACQLTYRWQAITRPDASRRAMGSDLIGDLPRDRNGRAFFDAKKHAKTPKE